MRYPREKETDRERGNGAYLQKGERDTEREDSPKDRE